MGGGSVLLTLINWRGRNKRGGGGVGKNLLISVMNEKRDKCLEC